ncbi:MAG: hypothetical protein LBJ12_01670 [Oscillospiraceae bacterium]|nr:hypothetical protein [Oscillospiraceae bacterium]
MANHLIDTLDEKYKADSVWDSITSKLGDGIDLETALSDVTLRNAFIDDVIKETWKFISKADLKVFFGHVLTQNDLPLAKLIHKFYQPHPLRIYPLPAGYSPGRGFSAFPTTLTKHPPCSRF